MLAPAPAGGLSSDNALSPALCLFFVFCVAGGIMLLLREIREMHGSAPASPGTPRGWSEDLD